MKRIPVVELIRVSTADQAEDDRAGIARQEAACSQAVQEHDLEVVRRIRLVDVSGTNVLRTPELAEMLELVRSGCAVGIVAADLDRLLRPDDFRSFSILQDIKEAGARIFLPGQVVDLDTQSGYLMSGFQSLMAGNELAQIKKRMNGAKEAMRLRGECPSAPHTLPMGVAYDKETRSFHYTGEAAVVAEMFRLYASGVTNQTEIARQTGQERTRVARLLRNQIYIGWRVYDTKRGAEKYAKAGGRQAEARKVPRRPDEVVRVRVMDAPLVSEEVFWQVQDLLNTTTGRLVQRKVSADNFYLFRGMVYCGVCGEPMYTGGIPDARRGVYPYYFCRAKAGYNTTYKGRERCDSPLSPRFRAGPVEEMLLAFIADCLASEAYILRQLEDLVDGDAQERRLQELEDVRRRQESVAARKKRLLDLYLDGGFDRTELDRRNALIRTEEEALDARAHVLRSEAEAFNLEDHAETIRQMALAFAEFPFWPRPEKRTLLESLQPEFHITTEGVTKVILPIYGTAAIGKIVFHTSGGRLTGEARSGRAR